MIILERLLQISSAAMPLLTIVCTVCMHSLFCEILYFLFLSYVTKMLFRLLTQSKVYMNIEEYVKLGGADPQMRPTEIAIFFEIVT